MIHSHLNRVSFFTLRFVLLRINIIKKLINFFIDQLTHIFTLFKMNKLLYHGQYLPIKWRKVLSIQRKAKLFFHQPVKQVFNTVPKMFILISNVSIIQCLITQSNIKSIRDIMGNIDKFYQLIQESSNVKEHGEAIFLCVKEHR